MQPSVKSALRFSIRISELLSNSGASTLASSGAMVLKLSLALTKDWQARARPASSSLANAVSNSRDCFSRDAAAACLVDSGASRKTLVATSEYGRLSTCQK